MGVSPRPSVVETTMRTQWSSRRDGSSWPTSKRGGFDTYLYLHGPDGARVASDDDGGMGLNSYLRHEVATAGTYEVRASQFSAGRGGPYTLVIRAGDPSAFPASADTPAERQRILRERRRRYQTDEHEH